MKTIYCDDTEMFLVQLDEVSGKFFLKVLVGGVGMYEVTREMSADMVQLFNSNPRALLSCVKEIRLSGK